MKELRENRPRKVFVGARTSDARLGAYAEEAVEKLNSAAEKIYPRESRSFLGRAEVVIGIKPDGSLESVEISRSSGNKNFDEAVLRIVKHASPFAEFPPEIRRDTDLLYLVRTLESMKVFGSK